MQVSEDLGDHERVLDTGEDAHRPAAHRAGLDVDAERALAALRPRTSPSRPITIPPSGRTTMPTPNAAKVDNREVISSPAGKSFLAITVAMQV
jgi:hypothetical protein